jgi:pimeloyl-ACP methyl ester carboxylesterase
LRTSTVQVGPHRIEANVFGQGTPAIVIEPSFGGVAAEWQPIAEALARDTTVITYDRVPYGASSRHILSGVADHSLHQGDPDLIISAAREVLHSVRTGTPLQSINPRVSGEGDGHP